MSYKMLIGCLLICFGQAAVSQNLVSATQLGSKTRSQLSTQFNLPFIQYGAQYYRVTYTTTNLQGLPDTVSGLIAVPDAPDNVYPRLVYQHGTSSSKLDVPSYNVLQANGEGSIGLLFAGMGFVSLLPDYLGLGISDGFHPYVHAASEAQAGVDLLLALEEFASQHGVHYSNQLFLTGYSQGGHASMALHREIEQDLSPATFEVTAAAHLSGPYSVGEVMRDLILSDSVYFYPAYIPNTILSYQTVYGNLFNQISDVFQDPYAGPVSAFYSGAINLGQLNTQLVSLLVSNEGNSYPMRMLQPDIVQAVETDPDHPFNVALRDNNVYAWAPLAPTRLFYCMADDQVPYRNSLVARDTMLAYGAADLVATDVNPAADHGECVAPALTNALVFFLGFQQISPYLSTHVYDVQPLDFFPNPAKHTVTLRLNDPLEGAIEVYDTGGRLCLSTSWTPAGTRQLDISGLKTGIYLIRLVSGEKIRQGMLVVD
ncbi:MAG: T9SS type A sorting domain-containing protein [Bacteroidetes bacterium]|nr:MAG: T9SS type A sorting domain-containing protein [Bacteroidota bacterium]